MLRKPRRPGPSVPSHPALLALWALLGAACSASHSGSSGSSASSGETHFLRSCASGCGEGLACVCGVCTRACTSAAACDDLAERATCSEPGKGVCGDHPGTRACEVACTTDANCSHLSEDHRCVEGSCRAEAHSEAGAASSDASETAPTPDAAAGGLDASAPDAAAGGLDASAPDAAAGGLDASAADAARPDASRDAMSQDSSASSDGRARVACGAATCAEGQVCCDHCTGRCVSALSGAFCPDDSEPNRSCDDGSVAACAPQSGSCLVTPCCPGLSCCTGVPVPAGQAVCHPMNLCPVSDRDQKTGFADIDQQAVLERVVALPIQSWRYKNEPETISHIGPMAQDFKASFGVGVNDKQIFPLDEGGVSLAAIQALHKQLDQLQKAQSDLRLENQRLRHELDQVRRELRKR